MCQDLCLYLKLYSIFNEYCVSVSVWGEWGSLGMVILFISEGSQDLVFLALWVVYISILALSKPVKTCLGIMIGDCIKSVYHFWYTFTILI